jgi:hypothetical protein
MSLLSTYVCDDFGSNKCATPCDDDHLCQNEKGKVCDVPINVLGNTLECGFPGPPGD